MDTCTLLEVAKARSEVARSKCNRRCLAAISPAKRLATFGEQHRGGDAQWPLGHYQPKSTTAQLVPFCSETSPYFLLGSFVSRCPTIASALARTQSTRSWPSHCLNCACEALRAVSQSGRRSANASMCCASPFTYRHPSPF